MELRKTVPVWALCIGLGLGLAGCARLTETGMLIFATTVPALATVNGQAMQGEVQLVPDRTGSVVLRSNQRSANATTMVSITSCMGRLRFTSTAAGEMDLRCNDGLVSTLYFSMISDASGYAYSQNANEAISLTFGVSPAAAKAYFPPPTAKKPAEVAQAPVPAPVPASEPR